MNINISLILPHIAYLVILGMLFFFYLRQQYIRQIVKLLSGESDDYKKVRTKVKKLGVTCLALFAIWLVYLLPVWVIKIIKGNPDYVFIYSIISATAFFLVFTLGANIAKWLVHDEDYHDHLKKNQNP